MLMKPAQYLASVTTPDGRKLPVDPHTNRVIDAQNPANWTTETEARAALHDGARLAYNFTTDDPYVFIDIDDCLVDGQWSALALEICAMLPEAYMEVSQSGKALHIICSVRSVPAHSCKNTALHLEMYHERRFIAITGVNAQGSVEADYTEAIAALAAKYFSVSTIVSPDAVTGWTTGPCPEWQGHADDTELLAHAMKSRSTASAFGSKASFKQLWAGDVNELARIFPPTGDNGTFDASSADAALASHLAFWTGRDCERTRRLMLSSGLVRDKWQRDDYLNGTILKMASTTRGVHSPKVKTLSASGATGRGQWMSPGAQTAYFEGCAYIVEDHAVATPSGVLLPPAQFKSRYAGHTFTIDETTGKTTSNAWEAFVESRVLIPRTADGSTFAPLEAAGELLVVEGRTLWNSWAPVEVECAPGDIAPFSLHLAKLFPNEIDRRIMLAYMSFVVQYPGYQARWAPLIQGAQGNGKTLLSEIVMHAVGMKYSHSPNQRELSSKFNDWMYRKLFIAVEDFYAPGAHHDVIESLKGMMSNPRIEIEPKGGVKTTRNICANFLFNTNYKDAMQKTEGDRRFAPFYTPQQTANDVQRDMPASYFIRLTEWLKTGGYGRITHYLRGYSIPDELNPAKGCLRAPETSSTGAALLIGRGATGDEILEAIENEQVGFRGGWISSHYLGRLLDDTGMARTLPRNKRREALEGLGYILHPGLPDGRVNNSILPDEAKPVIYIKTGHRDTALKGTAVSNAYTTAQVLPVAVVAALRAV